MFQVQTPTTHFPLPSLRLSGRFVVLEPLGMAHAAGLLAAATDESIWRYMPCKPPRSQDDMQLIVDIALAAAKQGTEVPFVIKDRASGEIVGSTRYLEVMPQHKSLEIGWSWVAPSHQRTAVNTEAKYLLLRHAFEVLDAIRVQIKTDLRNERAQRAIERLGAVREGVLRKHRILPDGFVRDSVYYSIIADEWPVVKVGLEAKLGC